MGSVTYTAGQSGNFTVPGGVTELTVSGAAGGASGSAAYYITGVYTPGWARGGGGGGSVEGWKLTVAQGQVLAYSVGEGGPKAVIDDAPNSKTGTNGGNTTFGDLTANGGAAVGTGGNATDGTNTGTGGAADAAGSTYTHANGGKLHGGGGGGNPLGDPGHVYYGGNSKAAGGNGSSPAADNQAGGGGGSYGAGGDGTTAGNATAGTDGGGGGGAVMAESGAGGNGFLTITWTDPPARNRIWLF